MSIYSICFCGEENISTFQMNKNALSGATDDTYPPAYGMGIL